MKYYESVLLFQQFCQLLPMSRFINGAKRFEKADALTDGCFRNWGKQYLYDVD